MRKKISLNILNKDLKTVLGKDLSSFKNLRFGEKVSLWKQHRNKIIGVGALLGTLGAAGLMYKNKKQIKGRLQPGALQKTINRKSAKNNAIKNIKLEAKKTIKQKKFDTENHIEQKHNYASTAGFELLFGKKFHFGETNVNKIVENIKNDPKKSSRVKRGLYTFLKKTGYKLGDYADYTLKALIKITVKYVGPIVLASLLIKYRKPISNKLISKEDRDAMSNISFSNVLRF